MQGYDDWVKHHSTLFGLFGDKEIAMLAAWEPIFEARGLGIADLFAASDWIAANAPPRFPNEHLGALLDRLRHQTAVAYRHATEEAAYCVECQGTGRLIVPHLSAIRGEDWLPMNSGAGPTWYTMAVTCPCERGRFSNFTDRAGDSLMRLDAYEYKNPHWREQMRRHDLELIERDKVRPGGRNAALDAVLESLGAR